MYSISALMKSVFPIRSPGSKRYGHHLLTVPVVTVVDTKRTEQYKTKPATEPNLKWMIQSNLVNTDTEAAIESVHIKWVEFRENVRAFFSQGQNKLSVIMMCLYKAGVRKARFDCTSFVPFWLARGRVGGGTPLYKPCRFVPPQRVWILGRLGLNTGIDFPILVWNQVWFSRELGSVWTYLSFQSQMNKTNWIEICYFEMRLKKFFVCALIKVMMT